MNHQFFILRKTHVHLQNISFVLFQTSSKSLQCILHMHSGASSMSDPQYFVLVLDCLVEERAIVFSLFVEDAREVK